MDVYLAATGGKQPSGRFRPGIIATPFAEHDLAHYVIDAAAGGLARSGVVPYLEYDPEMGEQGPAAAANQHRPKYAVMVGFGAAREGGVRIQVGPDCDDEVRAVAAQACARVAERCGIGALGVATAESPWLLDTYMPAWRVEVAALDEPADRERLQRPDFLQRAGEALAEAWCDHLERRYRGPGEGAAPVESAPRVPKPERTGWFADNHPTLALGAGCQDEPSDPTAHVQTMLGVLVDGRFGYLTQMALQAVQRRFGLTEDGVCGPATWAVLHSVERQGSVGYTTKEIQRELNIVDDGVFGPVTGAHVESFQREVDTASDGRMTADHFRCMLARP